jgi:hypothetical protein
MKICGQKMSQPELLDTLFAWFAAKKLTAPSPVRMDKLSGLLLFFRLYLHE